jgi:hypothetical protein
MDHLVVQIKKKNKLAFIKEILKAFDYVEVLEPGNLSPKEKKWLQDLSGAAAEVSRHKQGKAKLKSAKDLLHEL